MKLTATLAGLAGLNILLGFTTHWYIITTLGPGSETDALFGGIAIPAVILAIFSDTLTNVLVPLLSTEEDNAFPGQAWTFFQGVALFHLILVVLFFTTASIWTPWFFPGFDAETKSLTVTLIRIQLVGMLGTALVAVLTSACYSRQKFLIVEVSAIVSAVIGLGLLVWCLPKYGVEAVAWIMVLRVFIQTLNLIPVLGSYKKPDWNSSIVKEAWRRLRPLLIGTSYYKTDRILDHFFASMAPSGGLSLLHLAQQIFSAGHQLLNKSISNPIVPILSQDAHSGKWEAHRKHVTNRIVWMLGLSIAAVSVLYWAGHPILALLFGHGKFQPESIDMLWWIMVILGASFIARSASQILTVSFYSRGNTRIPTIIGSIGYTLGIPLRIGLFYLYGLTGIVLAISIQAILNGTAHTFFTFKFYKNPSTAE